MAETKGVEEIATRLACSIFEKELNLKKAFSKLDADGDGLLDVDELAAALRGTRQTSEKIAQLFALFDADGNGRISAREFQDALMTFGGGAAPPPATRRGAARETEPSLAAPAARPARHVEAIEAATEYEQVDGETMTDGEVLDALSDRLEEEGVPLHDIFRVLTGGRRDGKMDGTGLRDVLVKMGLGYTLASAEEESRATAEQRRVATETEAAALPRGSSLRAHAVGDALERTRGFGDAENRADAVLRSGDASDAALLSLLPLLKSKMYQHGFDTGKVGDLFLKLDTDRDGGIAPREFFRVMGEWGVCMSPEQCLLLLEPFDLDLNGCLDYAEFCRWVAMWDPPIDESAGAAWRRGGSSTRGVTLQLT